jgi:tRNA (guanine-N7-)-methyltransferase
MGAQLLEWAVQEPQQRILGVELYEPGIGSVLSRLASDKIDNVLVIERPAQEVLAELDEGMVSEIRIFFPDPWPKTRHHKRRLIQPDFVTQLARVMADSAIVRLATDWAPYASRMRRVFAEETTLLSVHDAIRVPGDHSEAGDDEVRGITKFEARGEKLGHEIHDLVYRRKPRE